MKGRIEDIIAENEKGQHSKQMYVELQFEMNKKADELNARKEELKNL